MPGNLSENSHRSTQNEKVKNLIIFLIKIQKKIKETELSSTRNIAIVRHLKAAVIMHELLSSLFLSKDENKFVA
jgi:hypothetical protein